MGIDNHEMVETLRRIGTVETPPLDGDRLFELMRTARREFVEMHPELASALPQPPVVSSRRREDGSIEWAM